MRQRIVTTDFDDGVRITQPADEVHAFMTRGGGWFEYINHRLLGRGVIQYEIDKEIAHGRRKDLAVRYVNALDRGGLTDAEYFEIIRDRDCGPHGTAHELWDIGDISRDRWFRAAWRRGHNGGPIEIDLEKARICQVSHIDNTIKKLMSQQPKGLAEYFEPKAFIPEIDLRSISVKIKKAETVQQVRAIWPSELLH